MIWSAKAPWFPAVGTVLTSYLPSKARSSGVSAKVEELHREMFVVEVWCPIARAYATFRKANWAELSPEARTEWLERDLAACSEKIMATERRARAAVKQAMAKR